MSETKKFLENILKESDEVPYCDDVNCEKLKERKDPEEGFEIDDELAHKVHYCTKINGVVPVYHEDTNTIVFYNEDTGEDVDTIVYRNQTPEEIKKYMVSELGLNLKECNNKSQKVNEAEEEQPEETQEESANEFEQLSPEVQTMLNDMSNDNAMYKWVIDDVMDSVIDYEGDNMDEKLKSRLEEITEHGCQSGTVGSLIYYDDTVKFFDNFNDEICNIVEDYYGAESVLDMLKQHCELIDIVMGSDTVKNYLAWMAYEVTCANILDGIESA